MKKLIAIAALSISTAVSAQALKVSTGGKDGTYSKMFGQLNQVCANQMQLTEVNSSGSMQNIDRIIGNEVSGALAQTDVLLFRGRTEDLSNVKTLVALHPEELHIVALAVQTEKVGGTMGFGAKPIKISNIQDLAGRTVVAAGGSYITAQVIRLQSEIDFKVIEVASNKEALDAVTTGKASAAFMVGGSPFPVVQSLSKSYTLLSIPEVTVAKLKNVYRPARLNYSNMGAAGVTSVATDALFVVRNYKTTKFVTELGKLRKCILENIPTLAETPGTHPSFSKIDVDNKGKMPWYELPK